MSIRILYSRDGTGEVMYDSVTMQAFGPVFEEDTFLYGLYDFLRFLESEYSVKDAHWFHWSDRLRFDAAYYEWLAEVKKEVA